MRCLPLDEIEISNIYSVNRNGSNYERFGGENIFLE
jgi:hypothetical protein